LREFLASPHTHFFIVKSVWLLTQTLSAIKKWVWGQAFHKKRKARADERRASPYKIPKKIFWDKYRVSFSGRMYFGFWPWKVQGEPCTFT